MSKQFSHFTKSFLGTNDAIVRGGVIFPASKAQIPSDYSNITIENTDASSAFYPTFVSGTGTKTRLNVDVSGFVYDPSNNRLAINKTNPQFNLDVSGTANITGNLSVDTNTLFVDASNNRVGIIKTNPSYPLDVNGSAKFTSLIDAENSKGTNGQVLISNGDGYVWTDADSNINILNTTSSSTIHYPMFADDSGFRPVNIDKSGLAFQPSTNNFGIGNVTPAYTLDVSGTANITGNVLIRSNTDISQGTLTITTNTSTGNSIILNKLNPSRDNYYNSQITFQENGVDEAYIWHQADVSGQLEPSMLRLGNGSGTTSWSIATNQINKLSYGHPSGQRDTLVGIRYGYNGNTDASVNKILHISNNDANPLVFTTTGRLGVGTTSPAYNLDVVGTANITGQTIISTPLVKIGQNAGQTNQGANCIAIGNGAGQTQQVLESIAIGGNSGQTNQGFQSVAIGQGAGQGTQGNTAVAIGYVAGRYSQGTDCIAIGSTSANSGQKFRAVAIGYNAGFTNQGTQSIGIGQSAGYSNQGEESYAIGGGAGFDAQKYRAIAIGREAGFSNQGSYSIAIGYRAGQTDQSANSIILNGSSNALNANTSGFFVNPIRNVASSQLLQYNTSNSEFSYSNRLNNNLEISGNLSVNTNTLFVDASNNRVGIGTTDCSESLDVSGWIRVGTNTGLKFRTSGASGTPNISVSGDNILSFNNTANITTMALTNNNLVGIGTTAPSRLLEVVGEGTGNPQVRIRSNNADPSKNAGLLFTGVTNDVSANRICQITLDPNGANGTGSDYLYIEAKGDGASLISNQANAPLTLQTNKLDRITILGDGKVGVGTNNPNTTLSVGGSSGQMNFYTYNTTSIANFDTWVRVAQLTPTYDNTNLADRGIIDFNITLQSGGAVGVAKIRIIPNVTIQAEWYSNNNSYVIQGVRISSSDSSTLKWLEIKTNVGASATNIFSCYILGSGFAPSEFTSSTGSTALKTFNFADYNTLNNGSFLGTIEGSYSILTNSTSRIKITDTGNVGIGTTAPSLTLDVSGGSIGNSAGDLTLNVNSTGAGGALKLAGGTGLLSGSAGGSSGQHLVLTINGTNYKIALLNT